VSGLLIRSRPGAAAARPIDYRYAKLTPPERGPFAVPKRRAGIPARVTTSAGSRPTAAGIQGRKVPLAPKPVTFFRLPPPEPLSAPAPTAAARPAIQPTPARADETPDTPPLGPQALLGW
jgi:hypothetical protein